MSGKRRNAAQLGTHHAQRFAGATMAPVLSYQCPAWCEVSHDEHMADLAENDGGLFHVREIAGAAWSVHISLSEGPGGAKYRSFMVDAISEAGLTPKQCRQMAAHLIEAAALVEAGGVRA